MKPIFVWGLAVSILGCGGSRTSPQSPAEPSASPPPAPVPAASTSALPSIPKADDGAPAGVATSKAHSAGQHYVLDVKAPGNVGVGGAGELEIVLLAKDGYHINDEFPYKLRTSSEPPGAVTFEKAEITRAMGAYTKTEARFKAKFVGAKAAEAKIGGLMALSVCTAKECVIDKIQLEVPVTVR